MKNRMWKVTCGTTKRNFKLTFLTRGPAPTCRRSIKMAQPVTMTAWKLPCFTCGKRRDQLLFFSFFRGGKKSYLSPSTSGDTAAIFHSHKSTAGQCPSCASFMRTLGNAWLIINHRRIWERWLIPSRWVKGRDGPFARAWTRFPPLSARCQRRLCSLVCVCVWIK